jgi:HK97 family phage prohead protease
MADGAKKSGLNYRAATLQPASYDADAGTVDVVWSTGADVARSDYAGGRWIERLSMTPESVRLDRMNAGAPLIDSHDGYSVRSIFGAVVPGSAMIEDGKGIAKVRLSTDPDKAGVVGDVASGVIRNISVGFMIHAQEVDKPKGGVETRIATDWEPYEISLVAMPADAGAAVRALSGETMDPQPVSPVVDVAAERAAAVAAERARATEIRSIAGKVGLSDVGQKCIDDGVTVDAARAVILDALATRDAKAPTHGIHVSMQRDGLETRAALLTDALAQRVGHKGDKANPFGGVSMARAAEALLRERGVIGADEYVHPARAVELALKHRTHTTSDFASILANVQNKVLMDAYLLEGLNFAAFCRQRDLPDFKSGKLVNILPMGSMVKAAEGSPVQYVTRTDTGETYALVTYNQGFSISRQAIVNDDLAALADVPMAHGAAAARLQKDVVWAIFTDNSAMADSIALFHASHSNLGTAAALSATTLAELRQMARKQTAGSARLALELKHMIVPPELEGTARKLLGPTLDIAQAASAAADSDLRMLQLIVEPRLSDSSISGYSATAHFASAAFSGIYYGYLAGTGGPVVQQVVDFDTDAVKSKCVLDFGANVGDYRYLFKNAGA